MIVSCEVCRITLSEKDVPSHNSGKRHLNNLKKKKRPKNKYSQKGIDTKLENEKNKSSESDKQSNEIESVAGCSKSLIEIVKPETCLIKTNEKQEDSKSHNVETSLKITNEGQIETSNKVQETTPNKVKETTPNKVKETTPNKVKETTPNKVKETTPNKVKETTPNKVNEIQRRQREKRKFKEENPKPVLPFVNITNTVPFHLQVIDIVKQLQQTILEYNKIRAVLQDVETTFKYILPYVQPILYGSSYSNLAFKTSDIDVFLFNPRGELNRDFIQRDGGVIYRYRFFSNIIRITNARVPVIKATHIRTGIELDISATSGQAVANSRLLHFLLSYDNRIRLLMMLIAYFGKLYNLIGVNKFSRYSINLLIIFYLQNLNPSILPPLRSLVYGTPDRPWPHSFIENRLLLRNDNMQSLDDLFMGFFQFYVDFPFTKYLISTYLSKKIPMQDMENNDILESMVFYKKYLEDGGVKIGNKCMCVQDPLELCHNTTKGINEKVLHQFKFICTNVLQIRSKIDMRNWIKEMTKMEFTPPFVEKNKEGSLSFDVKYCFTSDDKITELKETLELIFMALSIDTDWNCPLAEDEAKKMKLDPGLTFTIETRKFCFPKSIKWFLNQLKLGHYTLPEFGKAFSEGSQNKHQTMFCAQCFISLDRPEGFRITMKKNCANKYFFTLTPILKNYFDVLIASALKIKSNTN